MKKTVFKLVVVAFSAIAIPCFIASQSVAASDPDQMSSDMEFCKEHAKLSSGFDPANPEASVESSGPPAQRGAGLRGAARGAAKGALVGGVVESVGDDSHDDATEIGAATGAVTGGLRSRREARQDADAQEDQAISSGSAAYSNLYNECMKGRGY